MADGRVYDSRAIANYIIEDARENGIYIDALKLIKLVYLSHGWTLGLLNKPLLEDDVEAWQYGPVVRRIYGLVAGRREAIVDTISDDIANLTAAEKNIIHQVVQKYGVLSGGQLSKLTHQPGTPWDITWRAYGKNAVIAQDLIEKHFRSLNARRAQIADNERRSTARG